MARDDYASGPEDVEQGFSAGPTDPAAPALANMPDLRSRAATAALGGVAHEDDSLLRQLRRGTIVDGKYRIDERLGRGSMGIVVAATHIHLDERVALKFLHSRIQSTTDDFQARFQREAQMSAKLRGEHVARVIDIGLWQDRYPFMVMDHLTGVDLRSTRKAWGGALSVDLATEYVVQICEGMAEAHALGIVHCDLKPSNIFVTKRADGSDLIKILDFGISKWSMQEEPNEDVTYTGMVLGSPKYMAPERLFGSSAVDARADIWSIGALFYELLVGRPPFDFPTLRQMFEALREQVEPPSIREKNHWVTPALEAVVLRCFAHDQERRVANVAELAGAILDAVGEPYANEVQARLTAVLDAHGTRDSIVGASGARASRSSGQVSPGIRSAHTEDHAGARRHASSIPPPLPSAPPKLPSAAPAPRFALTALLTGTRQRLALASKRALGRASERRSRVLLFVRAHKGALRGVAALCLATALVGVVALLSTRRVRPRAQVGTSSSAPAPADVAFEPALQALPPVPTLLAPAVTAAAVNAAAVNAEAVNAPEAAHAPKASAKRPLTPVNAKRDLPRGTARVRRDRSERPAAESARASSDRHAREPSVEPMHGPSSAPQVAQPRAEVWGAPSAPPSAELSSSPSQASTPRAEKVWGLPSVAPVHEPSSPSRSPLEDRL